VLRALVGAWRGDGKPPTTRTVLLQIGVRRADGSIAIGVSEPALERDAGEPLGVLLLSADEAANLLDRLVHALDQSGAAARVNRKLSARERALSKS